jgi:hypothetical protein
MSERISTSIESNQSEPVDGIPQAVYNGTQIRLMDSYGAVRWIEEGMAELYGDYAEKNPDQILAVGKGELDPKKLLEKIKSKKTIN